jgi:hypothetical protein
MVSKEGGDDPVAAICPRTESSRRWGGAGCYWPLRPNQLALRAPRAISLATLPEDHKAEAERLARCGRPHLQRIGEGLGVTEDSLRRLLVGWDEREICSTWPEWDGWGRVVGLLRRYPRGRKWVRPGDRCGIFVPTDLPDSLAGEALVVTEGGSDCAAALSMGLWAIGRHASLSGGTETKRVLLWTKPAQVIVISDNDASGTGRTGAELIARQIRGVAREVAIVAPPQQFKDLREWYRAGARASDITRRLEIGK